MSMLTLGLWTCCGTSSVWSRQISGLRLQCNHQRSDLDEIRLFGRLWKNWSFWKNKSKNLKFSINKKNKIIWKCQRKHQTNLFQPFKVETNRWIQVEKLGRWQWALHLFHAMKMHQLSPNQVALSATISACEKGTQWQRALHLLYAAKKSGCVAEVFPPSLVCWAAKVVCFCW